MQILGGEVLLVPKLGTVHELHSLRGMALYLRPTSYFLLPTSYFLLPTSYFLLPTSYFLHPTSGTREGSPPFPAVVDASLRGRMQLRSVTQFIESLIELSSNTASGS